MKFIKKLFQDNKLKPEIIESYSHKTWDDLTEYEMDILFKTQKCPDCKTGKLLSGPSGGGCTNYMCNYPKCGSKFNFSPPDYMVSQRISERSPAS